MCVALSESSPEHSWNSRTFDMTLSQSAIYRDRSLYGCMSTCRGFTLLEIIITLAVAGILLSVAAPSFSELSSDTRQSTNANRFTSAMRYARSESTKRAAPISVCARKTDTTCGSTWANGWIIYVDREDTGTLLTLDSTDEILKVADAVSAKSIKASAVIRPASVGEQDVIQFNARGRTNWDLGTIVICDSRGATEAKALAINGIGMVRKLSADNGSAPLDAFGTAVTCP